VIVSKGLAVIRKGYQIAWARRHVAGPGFGGNATCALPSGTDADAIRRIMGQSVQGGRGEDSILDAWINNSVTALSSDDPMRIVLSGPKVNSFMLNLVDEVNEVTNDAWIANYTGLLQDLLPRRATTPARGWATWPPQRYSARRQPC
jgi:hypothetical protein